jgi:signal peptidase II
MPGESRLIVPHLFYLTYVQNTHGAFGLFGDRTWLLVAISVVVLGIFYVAFREAAAQSLLVRIAFGAILGGALGNIIDRLQRHFVVDFIDVRVWPVFNLADSFITIGVALLLLATAKRRPVTA